MNQGARGLAHVAFEGWGGLRCWVVALALVVGGGICAVPPLSAKDAEELRLGSDLRTPKGWERRRVPAQTTPFRPVLLPDAELVVPAAWAAPRGSTAAAGGGVCSELVVPEAWRKPRVAPPAR